MRARGRGQILWGMLLEGKGNLNKGGGWVALGKKKKRDFMVGG